MPGQAVRKQLRGSEAEAYEIELVKGQFVDLTVRQERIDIAVQVVALGELLYVIDSPTSTCGTERLPFLVEKTGSHRFEVHAFGGRDTEGSYEIEIAVASEVTEREELQAEAAKHALDADHLRSHGDLPGAIRAFEESLAGWLTAEDTDGTGRIRFRLGELYSEPERAKEEFKLALPLLHKAGNLCREGISWHHLGNIEFRQGQLSASRQAFSNAREIFSQIGSLKDQAKSTRALGVVHRQSGELARAIELYDSAAKLWEQLGDSAQRARALHNRGRLYLELGDFDLARDDFEHALEIWPDTSPADRLGTHIQLAHAHLSLGELQSAEASLDEADILSEKRPNSGTAELDQAWGRFHAAIKKPEEALERLESALASFKSSGPAREISSTLFRIATNQMTLGRDDEALDALLQALPLADRAGDPFLQIAIEYRLAQIDSRRDLLRAARQRLSAALDRLEALRSGIAGARLRSLFSARVQNLYDLDVALLMKLHRRHPGLGFDAAALAASERGRARSLIELLSAQRVDLGLNSTHPLIEQERDLWRQINTIESKRLRGRDGAEGKEGPPLNLLRRVAEVQSKIQFEVPFYAQLTTPRLLKAGEIQRRVLDQDTLLIEIELREEASTAWIVSQDSLTAIELPPQAIIERSARRAYRLLSDGERLKRTATGFALRDLSRLLLWPMLPHLTPGKRLLVVTEGALQYVPLGALPLPPEAADTAFEDVASRIGGVPLIALHETVYSPSASALYALRQQLRGRQPAPGAIAVIADPIFQAADSRLPTALRLPPAARSSSRLLSDEVSPYRRLRHSRAEADAILRQMSDVGETLAAFGTEAHRQLVLDGRLSRYRILHFATHGELDSSRPELSRLVLSLYDDDGRSIDSFLNSSELYRLHLPAELVVLSACRTALGEEIRGEGLTGLTQGFLYAGAARLIVSLWNVDDAAGAVFMSHFYRSLVEEDMSPAAALRAAKLQFTRQARWQDPFHWAGFVLQGEWHWNTSLSRARQG